MACPQCGEKVGTEKPAEQSVGGQLDIYFEGKGRPEGQPALEAEPSSTGGKEATSKAAAQKPAPPQATSATPQASASAPRQPSRVGQVARGTGRMIAANPGHFFRTLFSARWGCSSLLIALIPAALGAAITPVLGTVLFFLVFVPVWVIGAANPSNVLYCPFCRKRVKMGATTCHHCGRNVVSA